MRHKQRFFSPEDYTPKFYGYVRVSHKDQHDRGESVEIQKEQIETYYKLRLVDPNNKLNGAVFSRIFEEPLAQSAYSRSFPTRHAGGELVETLQPGDHVAITKLDRIFRNMEDYAVHRRWFAERKITLHLVNQSGAAFDTDSVAGEMLVSMLAFWAETESAFISDRVCRARAALRAKGRHQGTMPPFFCKVIDCEPGKVWGGRMVFKSWAEPAMERVEFLRDTEGMGFLRISHFISEKYVRVSYKQSEQLYWFWKAWNANKRPDINTFKHMPFVDGYRKEYRRRKRLQKEGEANAVVQKDDDPL